MLRGRLNSMISLYKTKPVLFSSNFFTSIQVNTELSSAKKKAVCKRDKLLKKAGYEKSHTLTFNSTQHTPANTIKKVSLVVANLMIFQP